MLTWYTVSPSWKLHVPPPIPLYTHFIQFPPMCPLDHSLNITLPGNHFMPSSFRLSQTNLLSQNLFLSFIEISYIHFKYLLIFVNISLVLISSVRLQVPREQLPCLPWRPRVTRNQHLNSKREPEKWLPLFWGSKEGSMLTNYSFLTQEGRTNSLFVHCFTSATQRNPYDIVRTLQVLIEKNERGMVIYSMTEDST